MFPFLNEVGDAELCRFVKQAVRRGKYNALSEGLNRQSSYQILFAIYGYDVLKDKGVRKLLLESVDRETLCLISDQLDITISKKSYDTIISIVNLPWSVGGRLASVFTKVFYIPADYLPSKLNTVPTIENIEPFTPSPPLFDYQEYISTELFSQISQNQVDACLVQLPTGAGKTRTVLDAVAKYLNQFSLSDDVPSVLWLGHTEELCEQAIESFRATWMEQGGFSYQVARLWGSYKMQLHEVDATFIVGGYQKVAGLCKNNSTLFQRILRQVKLVVVDEAHKALAPEIKRVIDAAKSRDATIVGLTATPGRGMEADLENIRLAKMFDKNLITTSSLGDKPIEELQRKSILANIHHVSLDTGIDFSAASEGDSFDGVDMSFSDLKKLAQHDERNKLIVKAAALEVAGQNPTLVFACSISHAKQLAIQLSYRGIRAISIDCTMNRALRRRVINEFKAGKIDVLLNYGVLSTGFDAPNIKTIIIARPTGSIVLYSQMIGRGLRGSAVGGSNECRVIDIKDNFINFGGVDDVYNHFNDFWLST